MNNYPIGDFVTRLKNAALARKSEVVVPYSRFKEDVARALEREGYITSFAKDLKSRTLTVDLTYRKKMPLITNTKIVSRPGVRIYKASRKLGVVLGGAGIAIVSTSKGVMSSREAKKKGLGGEIIAEIW